VVGYVRMFEEAIGELVRLSEEESVLYSCKSLGYKRKEKKLIYCGESIGKVSDKSLNILMHISLYE
jgi:hypothetical protein